MVISKDNPVGIDAVIANMQQQIYSELSALWDFDIDVYPRCYIVEKRDGGMVYRTVEHYKGSNDYINLLNAECNKCFFVQSGDTRKETVSRYSTTIDLYFTLDLKKIKNLSHRADAEVHADVVEVVSGFTNTKLVQIITGINRVYAGLRYNLIDDLEPFHCFKVQLDVFNFSINQKC